MPDKGLHVQQNENVDRGRLQVNVTSTLGLQPVVNARVGIAYTGESQRLLEELKNELLFANRNVNQLAEEFHFSDPSHLMRFFKRETEKTFTQYLRDYQNGIYE